MLRSGMESKTFWMCITRKNWPDPIDFGVYILECTGILLNTLTLVLISKKHSGPRVSLILLRGMIASYLISVIVNFMSDVYPYNLRTQNYHFNRLICIFWKSRFLYWIFDVMAGIFMALFAVDRYACLAQLDRFRITAPEYRSASYVIFVVVSALFLSLPQILTVNLREDRCDCALIRVSIPFLSLVYAHVYVWFSLLLVFQGSLMGFICVQLIDWKLNRLSANYTWRLEDDLNGMTLKQPVVPHLLKPQRKKKGTVASSICDAKGHKWTSASFCILPLTLSYVLAMVYDSTYQFLSALGLTTYIISSEEQRVGEMLLLTHSTAVPLIICFYIPSLRVFLKRQLKRAVKKKKAGSTVP
ncbi:unnamed protein product [Schistocephalus solidus]|uniref:G_PROTEIN_RECEP_F1_2 domain-containing protein n=1 Tax=Schistocephalus solidus TaxID=70667 RepID=A0A183SC53_SCHSO|nr:unnamed protein product [Schistocephalus solidus]